MKVLRGVLAPFSFLYGSLIFTRNKLFDVNILKAQDPEIFTVSIGNINLGGTGKTQLSIYLAKAFKNLNPCIILRGYKRKSKENLLVTSPDTNLYGDEAVEIYLKTKANVVVAFKRIEGAKICKDLGAKMLILDDAFSHRYIKRDLDIVLLPANKTKDHLLPWGNLREPFGSLKRADAVVITKLESYPMPKLDIDKPIFTSKTVFRAFIDKNFNDVDISLIKENTFDVVCALGDNESFVRFVKTLSQKIGFKIGNIKMFEDHHFYKKEDLEENKKYICSTKDLVKLKSFGQTIFGIDTALDIPDLIHFIKSTYEKA